ncbi:4-hydroxy-3-polyprenylbenzoate decarboxylase [Hydrogenimonas thermophila]|uniref:4-hydroxy-3-polyprenylbenzoate decarboxylase n=2 Tax=Hydrogenimonas thermophila TaxID=223786 RepID=A0A1I5QL75_9BACT|nr:4-hydroxy-3-polyprenylbenzoate decarboxylase [Hydrogenimonas thermophila]
MATMQEWLDRLERDGDLKIIEEPCDINLEIAHIAYVEVKKDNSKVLLFKRPVNREKGIEYSMPVVMNMFANFEITQKIFGRHPDAIAKEIEELMHMKPPQGFMEKLSLIPKLFALKNVFPKRLKQRGLCQQIIKTTSQIDLDELPILKTWSEDGGPFITMGQVYTRSLDGKMQNLGMYRLQQYDKNHLGMHWQIHKDASHFFDQYKDAGEMMPVSVAIGGDPLYIWCGQAPLPHGIFELLLYGFVRNEPAKLVKSITNDIWVPEDADIVIEGMVDPNKLEIEGPFGDHTGYYTLKEPYPVMEVTAITMKENPVYQATVVGKPPLEDKYMGWGTERIFLPLLKTTAPDLIDYHMPENGVFHNLILAQMEPHYKGHAKQFMHAFWGVGQMSFVKHAIFVGKDAPALTDYEKITEYILNRIDPKNLLISEGIVDALDHSSPETLVGGKLGCDCTGAEVSSSVDDLLDDAALLEKIRSFDTDVKALKQYGIHTKNPVCVIAYKKNRAVKELFDKISNLSSHIKILVVVDEECNDIENPYMLVWRVTNNIDAGRDIRVDPFIMIDATNKNELDGYNREWPGDVLCDKDVLNQLKQKGLIDIDENFEKRFYL